MFALNLPVADIKISQSQGKPTVYDFLRRRYVALTPEEWVRQQFTRFLTDHKGYPAALMGNEMEHLTCSKQGVHHCCTFTSIQVTAEQISLLTHHHVTDQAFGIIVIQWHILDV